MGNVITPCFHHTKTPSSTSSKSTVKLLFWEGTSRSLSGKHIAGDIMFEFPDKMLCHADSFFIGQPIPSLSIDDPLMPGQTYFVIPIDLFPSHTLSPSSLVALGSYANNKSPIKFGECPFEYLKGSNGRVLIKVMPEFFIRLISGGDHEQNNGGSPGSNSFLCSTPELQKQYEQLVKSKDQLWSPKLETISEYKLRFSPCRFIGLEWKEKEKIR
ncbi:hypothetical protein Lal_00036212 [Lupinus albus]|uniref:Uncharacterized protein n=1 Tax=Lupinus albus TaxID=3870 RepID=A0A6A4QMF8_LUPAL|nr:hypothetical protein Lalb_Chr04g0249191 [Lupinus albus]KAF1868774.1 hypothetical protein Lal_00036212 [Lupinus albus]